MEEDYISKKELLELTNISYGQLYRWKRKNLIPEQWFIRKSTFTGQETFFPKAQILARIQKIISLKDDASLNDLADVFSPVFSDITLSREELKSRKIVPAEVLEIYCSLRPEQHVFKFNDVLFLFIFHKALTSGTISLEEGNTLLRLLEERFAEFEDRNFEIIISRKLGVFTCFLVSSPCDIFFDNGLKVVFRAGATGYIEELKLLLSK